MKSYNIVKPLSLEDFGSIIENCLFSANGNVTTSKGAKQKNIIYKSPKWEDKKKFIPSKKSFLLKENNKINTIGLIKPLTK